MKSAISLLAVALAATSHVAVAAPKDTPHAEACAYPAPPAARGVVYTDLVSAPVGAWVTVYGSGFGAEGEVTLGGARQTVVTWSPQCVIFQVSGTGGDLTVGGRAAGKLEVRSGRVLEAKPGNFGSVWGGAKPGDVIYLRAGDYQQRYGEGTWYRDPTLETYRSGKPGAPIALVGYPGEKPVMKNAPGVGRAVIALGDGNSGRQRAASHLVFANFSILAQRACIYGGGDTTNGYGGPDETGGHHVRVVNLHCTVLDERANTMTGMIALQNDGWEILGTTFVDAPNRAIIKNNHAIYIQGGADDVTVAYNQLVNLRMGHVIQIHQDGTPKLYENIRIHDNLLEAKANTDMRGISVVGVDDASTVHIERNVLRNLGQDFSGIAVYRGQVHIIDNEFHGIRAPAVGANGQRGGTRNIIVSGNRFETVQRYPAVGAENGASLNEVKLANNRYCASTRPQEKDARPCP